VILRAPQASSRASSPNKFVFISEFSGLTRPSVTFHPRPGAIGAARARALAPAPAPGAVGAAAGIPPLPVAASGPPEGALAVAHAARTRVPPAACARSRSWRPSPIVRLRAASSQTGAPLHRGIAASAQSPPCARGTHARLNQPGSSSHRLLRGTRLRVRRSCRRTALSPASSRPPAARGSPRSPPRTPRRGSARWLGRDKRSNFKLCPCSADGDRCP
jgi:hypothetical protein